MRRAMDFLAAVAIKVVVGLVLIGAVIVLDTLTVAVVGIHMRLVVIAVVGIVAVTTLLLRVRRIPDDGDARSPAADAVPVPAGAVSAPGAAADEQP